MNFQISGGEPLSVETTPELYQWKANAQGGQEFGNQQVSRFLAEEDYQERVKPLLREGQANTLADYQKLHPEHTHISLIRKFNSEKLIPGIPFIGGLQKLRPQPGSQAVKRGWVKQVSSFQSPEALEHDAAVVHGALVGR
jgi:hypothetical protein